MTRVVIIGQGYVGLPLAREATAVGLDVVGLDTSRQTVALLNSGRSHVGDVPDSAVGTMLLAGYRATTDASVVRDADVVVVCVPTPLDEAGSPDLRAIDGAMHAVADHLTTGTLVVLESTTYPGTTDQRVLPILLSSGLLLDVDFCLAFSPERIDPGNPLYGLRNTPKVVGGVSEASTTKAIEFYSLLVDTTVRVRGSKEAETAKLLENTYRHVNIALVNEMARFCHALDIDIWQVIEAASTKPFGFEAFFPGPGVGGHCIPIDPKYLSYEVSRKLGYPFRFVELAQEINNSMPNYLTGRIQDLLNDIYKPLRDASILLLGVTYKANIADQRQSPATPLAELLLRKGAHVSFHDPFVSTWKVGDVELTREEHVQDAAQLADMVVLLQHHAEYEADQLAEMSSLFFDTRGVTRTPKAKRL
jgi:UDP-N-acetyl-D-glucosamine dehydrogenase